MKATGLRLAPLLVLVLPTGCQFEDLPALPDYSIGGSLGGL